jgi:hypothetical protein
MTDGMVGTRKRLLHCIRRYGESTSCEVEVKFLPADGVKIPCLFDDLILVLKDI